MEAVIAWVSAHYQDVFAIIGAVVTCATLIVQLTPSQRDDAVLAKVVAFLNWLSVVNPKPPAK